MTDRCRLYLITPPKFEPRAFAEELKRALDGGDATQGSGATHAWADVYLPGAGWVEYDPTNGLIAGENLIRVAVTRDPSQAIPISGTFTGATSDFLGFTVEVTVSRQTRPFDSNLDAAQPAGGSPAMSTA